MTALRCVPLSQAAAINPRLGQRLADDTIVSFVPMAAVSAEGANVTAAIDRPYGEVKKGYTYFEDRDVLLAKITPCFENGKIAQAMLPNQIGFGSTEFHVVRPKPGVSDGRYLHHYLRQPKIRIAGERHMTGSGGQRRVPASYLASLELPLPSLTEQRRIAAILDQADALRALRRQALAELDALAQAMFLEMFGDPAVNQKNWPLQTMRALFLESPIFGTMIPAQADGGSWLCLRVANIQDWQLDLSDQKFVDLPLSAQIRHSVRRGDLLMARAIASEDHLGKCIVAEPGEQLWAFDSHLMRLRFDHRKVLPEFIRHTLLTTGGRSRFLRVTRRSAVQFNVNTKEMAALELPIPPLALQKTFVARLQSIGSLKAAHRAALIESDALFASLQHRAFTGAL